VAVLVLSSALSCCRNDTIFAVKAPAGTTLEVPEPEMHQMEDGKLAQRFRCGCVPLSVLQGIAVWALAFLHLMQAVYAHLSILLLLISSETPAVCAAGA
jgi:hypothetical protein